ncbi:hypothetical protein BDB00DRAFT_788433 [Zychaea mexicana]|uniref:uncharacterized protein n=1 Tax=Zychaea mexicana TaxID=64656 RepID=UPI0022FF3F88|nr:uncharacterized protein BDB00DRAFT_788433 [Zychaea mexicana]KAI9492778.1 hypothetical protein BDB00DRAFT_788433 [Zychaea mexicana]
MSSKRCCCIIPLRGGVALLSIIIVAVSVLLVVLTFTHTNPMVMHLSVINAALPWVAVIFYIATGVIGLYGILAAAVGKLALMRLYKLLFWAVLVFLLTIWTAVSFILALVNRGKSQDACDSANPDQAEGSGGDQTVSVGDYSTTFLGMELGSTYGLANCAQAVQAGVIGLAILLFVGQISMFYFATVVAGYTKKLRERNYGHRLRDDEWNDNLDDLGAAYRSDAQNAQRYRMNQMNRDSGGNKFTKGLKKFKLGK